MLDNASPATSLPSTALTPKDILRLKALKEVVGGFAHEISQPLNALMIASQVVKMIVKKSPLNQSEQNLILQRLEIVTTQVRKAGSIIDTLRSFVKEATTKVYETNLLDVIDFVVSLMGQQLSARGIRLVQNLSEQPLITSLDQSTVECLIIAAMAFARDVVQAQKTESHDSSSSNVRAPELEISTSHNSPLILIRWDSQINENCVDTHRDKLYEACLVMTNAGGNIDITSSQIVLEFPPSK